MLRLNLVAPWIFFFFEQHNIIKPHAHKKCKHGQWSKSITEPKKSENKHAKHADSNTGSKNLKLPNSKNSRQQKTIHAYADSNKEPASKHLQPHQTRLLRTHYLLRPCLP